MQLTSIEAERYRRYVVKVGCGLSLLNHVLECQRIVARRFDSCLLPSPQRKFVRDKFSRGNHYIVYRRKSDRSTKKRKNNSDEDKKNKNSLNTDDGDQGRI